MESMIKRMHWQKKEQVRTSFHEHATESFTQMAEPGHGDESFTIRLTDPIHDCVRVWIFYAGKLLPGYFCQSVYRRQPCSRLPVSLVTTTTVICHMSLFDIQAPLELPG